MKHLERGYAQEQFRKRCATCSHKKAPQGGWCYMFREQPDPANQCGQYKKAGAA